MVNHYRKNDYAGDFRKGRDGMFDMSVPRTETESKFRYVVHYGTEAFLDLKPDWDRLIEQSSSVARIFMRHDWLRIWLEFRGARYHPVIVLIYDGDIPIGIIPLCQRSARIAGSFWTALIFMGTPDADYHDIIIDTRYDAKVLYSFAQKIIDLLCRKYSATFLEDLRSDVAKQLLSTSRNHAVRPSFKCPYTSTTIPWEEYNQRIFSSDVRRKLKKVKALGSVEYGVVQRPEELDAFLSRFFDMHRRRWAGTDTPSRFNNEDDRKFLVDLAKALGPGASMHLAYLSVNGKIVACSYGFQDLGRLYYYIPTFEPELSYASVGMVFQYYLLLNEYRHFNTIDFLRGDEPYKYHWSTGEDVNHTLFLYRTPVHRMVYRGLRFAKRASLTNLL